MSELHEPELHEPIESRVAGAAERLARAALGHPANDTLRGAVAAVSAVALFRALLAVVYRVVVLHQGSVRRGRRMSPCASWRELVEALSQRGALGALGLPDAVPDAVSAGLPDPAPDATSDPVPDAILDALLASEIDTAEVGGLLATLLGARPNDQQDQPDLPPFGALHEAMLACEPTLVGATLTVDAAGGKAQRQGRRASGSFYTPAPLVAWLLDAALDPALDAALDPTLEPVLTTDRLLSLRICDPSCGAGAFLEPAARRVAARLAALRGEARGTLDDVVTHCIYGVDLDPLAVFACQATLWLATLGPDSSDTSARATTLALVSHIRQGDSLLGADAALVRAGLPDLAFTAHPGDDRAVANAWRAQNRSERRALVRPTNLPWSIDPPTPIDAPASPTSRASLDAWCAAFFWPRTSDAPRPPTTSSLRRPWSPETTALVAHLARRHGFFHWETAFPDVADGFHVMLGNPPFLNQLEQGTVATRPAAALLRARFPDEVGPYTDTAALLLLQAARLLRPGGRLAMVQPQSILAAQDTRGVRAALAAVAPPTHVWWSGARVFPGTAVFVTALALHRGPPVAALTRAHGIPFVPLPPRALDIDALTTADTWAPLVADALGAPPLTMRTGGILGDLADATADFRDEYYGLIPHVVELLEADERRFPRLVLTGHIDPARSWWGACPVRFGKRTWIAPRVDLASLERDGALAAWANARRVPKLLLATQTRVLEAVADPEGAWLTTTPTISVLPRDPAHLWRVAAVLLGPPASAWALTHYGASALTAGALKLSARQVQAIPLPVHDSPWDEAAQLVADAHRETDPGHARALLELAAAAMVGAYEGDSALLTWWRERLPADERYPA